MTERLDVIAARLEAIAERLERLNVEGRLDDLDRRRLDEMEKRLRALEGAAK